MPQDEDKLLDRIFQKYKEGDSEEDLFKYILETVFNELLEKEGGAQSYRSPPKTRKKPLVFFAPFKVEGVKVRVFQNEP